MPYANRADRLARAAEYRAQHREQIAARQAAYRAEGRYSERRSRYRLKHRYNLTEAQREDMLAAQGGGCAICGETEGPFEVDHDHSCCPGKSTCGECVRQLLCRACNRAIGLLHDDPARMRAAAEYVERHAQPLG